ncbi:thiamine pyrophosphate-dependent enzyme [Rhodopila sp.]|uniref:thiamine pyrophosphate-dependent enzyme n=1 Tax=Rhodopila sp. TaxID=2480087 RepID=UPI002B61DE62|nr:thiamine pyrophosphate-dependent enzyme [Rhodopila sp.]HVZ10494.1 thiamine pyrophosphate-dependent enzyme [Rhodopila sp.]
MMHTADLLAVFSRHRGDAIVISGRGGRHWITQSDTAFDIPLGDPAMGGHAGFALGLALAQPDRRVVLFDSEGDILMSLGQLPTIAEQAPPNLYHFILDNEVYATTGGQPVPNAKTVDYPAIARACGYSRVAGFTELEAFEKELPDLLAAAGPVFVALKVWPEVENTPIGQRVRWRKRSADKVISDLRAALGVE